jgi:hypothetical protein
VQANSCAVPQTSGRLIRGSLVRELASCWILLVVLTLYVSSQAEITVGLSREEGGRPRKSSEVVFEGMFSYGNFRLFGAAENVKLYTADVEFDREVWPRFLGARVDYATEFLPVVLLSQPQMTDIWGNGLTKRRETIPGVGITPLGLRMLWRDGKRVMPYLD